MLKITPKGPAALSRCQAGDVVSPVEKTPWRGPGWNYEDISSRRRFDVAFEIVKRRTRRELVGGLCSDPATTNACGRSCQSGFCLWLRMLIRSLLVEFTRAYRWTLYSKWWEIAILSRTNFWTVSKKTLIGAKRRLYQSEIVDRKSL